MKTNFLMLLAAMLLSVSAFSQSDSLKAAYRQVCTTLKDYKYMSEDASDNNGKTLSITLNIQNGCFVFTFKDDFRPFNDPFFGNRAGTKTVKVLVGETLFDMHYGPIKIEGENGVEFTYKGKKEILKDFEICGEELSLKKLLKELQVLQRLIIDEEYKGTLGGGTSTSKRKSQATSVPQKNNKVTTAPQQTRQRKRVPVGN